MPAGTDYKKWDELDVSDDDEDIQRKKAAQLREDLSEKESRRIHDCMREPEFLQMLREYQEEISDPKNREEQELYLQQVEREARLGGDASVPGIPGSAGPGNGSVLIKPSPGFVVKVFTKAPRKKVMVNVVQHEDIAEPTVQRTPDGREAWQLPYIMSPKAKEEKDKEGHQCAAYDACFHPSAISRAKADARWKNMVARTARDALLNLHKLELEEELKMPRLKYFGNFGQGPSVLTHNKKAHDRKAEVAAKAPPLQEGDVAAKGLMAAKAKAPAPTRELPPPQPSPGPAAPARADTTAAAAPPPPAPETLPPPALASAHPAAAVPTYTIVHVGTADLADSFGDKRIAGGTHRPAELRVTMALPLLSSARSVDLEWARERALSVADRSGAYAPLHVALPYAVDQDAAKAKWAKDKRELVITIPVLPAPAPYQPDAGEQAEVGEPLPAEEAEAEKAKVAQAAALRARAEEERKATEREALRKAALAAVRHELGDDEGSTPPAESGQAASSRPRTPTSDGERTPASGESSGDSAEWTRVDAPEEEAASAAPPPPAPASATGDACAPAPTAAVEGSDMCPAPSASAARSAWVDGAQDVADGLSPADTSGAVEWRQNEHNVTMVVDVEGALAESAHLEASAYQVTISFRTPSGPFKASAQLAHAIDPAGCRVQVHGEFVLGVLRKATYGTWDVFEAIDLPPSHRPSLAKSSPSAEAEKAERPQPDDPTAPHDSAPSSQETDEAKASAPVQPAVEATALLTEEAVHSDGVGHGGAHKSPTAAGGGVSPAVGTVSSTQQAVGGSAEPQPAHTQRVMPTPRLASALLFELD